MSLKIVLKMEKVLEERRKCVEVCNKHGLTLSSFNLEDNLDEIRKAIDDVKAGKIEVPDEINVKELDKSVKYYKIVYDKLLYIDQLKELVRSS